MVIHPHHFFRSGAFNRRQSGSALSKQTFPPIFQSIFVRKSNDNLLIFKYIPSVFGVTHNIACTETQYFIQNYGAN